MINIKDIRLVLRSVCCKLAILLACLLIHSEDVISQSGDIVTFRSGEKIYLRWRPFLDERLAGYNVYSRDSQSEPWKLLTPEPLQMAFDHNDIRQKAGYKTELFLSLFGVDDPLGSISPQLYQNLASNPDALSFMEIMTLVNPELGYALGVIHVDSNFTKTGQIQYRVTRILGQNEADHALTGFFDVGTTDEVPSILSLEGETQHKAALLRWPKDNEALTSGKTVTHRLYRANNLLGPFERVNDYGILPVTVTSGDLISRENTVEHTDLYLVNGQVYYYFVRAVNPFGLEGPASPVAEVTPSDTRVPPAPNNLVAEVFGTGIRLQWDAIPVNLAGYEVFKAQSREEEFKRIHPKDDIFLDTTNWFLDLYVEEAGHYYYFVRSVSSAGARSPASDTLFFYLEDHTRPSPPGPVSATAEKDRIILSWPASPEPDITGYAVERASDDAFRTRFLLTGKILEETVYIDTVPAVSQTTYGYVVYAIDASNNRSHASEMVKARLPDQVPPLSPIMTGLEKVGNAVLIKWTRRSEPDLAGYRVYRSQNGPQDLAGLDITFTNSYTDTLEGSGKYYYAVTALDSAGNESPLSVWLSLDYDEFEMPSQPSSGEVREEKGALLVDWSPVDRKGTSGYLVTREDPATGRKTDIAQVKAGASSFLDRYADPARSYVYYIRTYDSRWRQSQPLILKYEP
jgi:fibronectin type 3 domain-containing protein